jgi:Zn-dependent protease with chaperone function
LNSRTRFHLENGFCFIYAKIKPMAPKFSTTAYRYPYEYLILLITFLVVLAVIAFTAAATVCGSAIFIPAVVLIGYFASRSRHHALIEQATHVTVESVPELIPVIRANEARLQVEPVEVFITPSNQLNAYTFGMDSPKSVVLY